MTRRRDLNPHEICVHLENMATAAFFEDQVEERFQFINLIAGALIKAERGLEDEEFIGAGRELLHKVLEHYQALSLKAAHASDFDDLKDLFETLPEEKQEQINSILLSAKRPPAPRGEAQVIPIAAKSEND
jgi:hypothetical protein